MVIIVLAKSANAGKKVIVSQEKLQQDSQMLFSGNYPDN